MVVFVIIGSLIGAGFASGQEIYLFFYKYGISGLIGLFICCTLISVIIYKSLKIIKNNNINSYKEFLQIIFEKNKIRKNKYLNFSFIINIIVNIFLLFTFFIMISGFGAYLKQEFNVNNLIGSGILALICFIIFMTNIKGVAKVSSVLVPILIFFIIIIGVKNLFVIDLKDIGENVNIKQNIFNNFFLQSIIYASYNMILLIPILVNLKKYIKNILAISLCSGGVLFILAFFIYFLLVNINIDFNLIEMPAVYAVGLISDFLKKLYGGIILISIFTTAISLGISFLENNVKNKKSFPQFAAIMCITSVAISNIGFSNLVKLLFPAFGYLGLMQIYYILIK